MALAAGTRLGPYEIVAPLGAGGMGEVYKARDPRLGRDVAIKVLPESMASDASRLHRFAQEARAVAALSHQNIVSIFDVGLGDHPYLVTELLTGETLRAVVERGPLPLKRAGEIGLQMLAGLAAAHGRGIVHRDLKPENIFVTHDGLVKILDFGLAKSNGPEVEMTMAATGASAILGTVGYMAPEQVRSEPVDARSDLFAVGAILYEMVSGQRAFHGPSPADTMSAVLREQPPDLTRRTGTPPAIARIVQRCLEKDPNDRFQSARDVRFALESISDVQAAVPAATKPADKKSIAVLPFVNMSADADNQFFSDGLAEELINALTALPGLHVASRTSSFRFRGRDADIKEIGTQLQVATVLDGSVRRAGTRLRVTVQLTSVADGYHLWSERYDREMTDVFAIQDEIVEAIVKAIAPALAGVARTTVKRASENVEAYELYLKARHFWLQRMPSTLPMAIKLFEQVIALDPEYALAYAGLADCYSIYRVHGWLPADKAEPRVREAVARAVELDPDLPEVQFAQALYDFYFERHWRLGIDHMKRAIALNPRYAVAHVYLAVLFACDGRVDETSDACERAYALEPASTIVLFLQSASLVMVGRLEDAEMTGRRLLGLQPESLVAWWPMTLVLLGLGRFDEAVNAGERLLTVSRASTFMGLAGLAYAKAGRTADARRLLAEMEERAIRGEYIAPFGPLAIQVGLGDVPEIRRLLEACVADRTPPLSIAASSGEFLNAYRSDPEIRRLTDTIFDRPASGPSA